SLLEQEEITAIFAPHRLPQKNMVMPMLVSDPALLKRADPLAPCFPVNSAKLVSRLTRKPAGGKIAAVLRPCEIRAFVELVKLGQGRRDELVIVGMDCLGSFRNTDYSRFAAQGKDSLEFCRNMLLEKETDGFDLSPACRACEYPGPENADIVLGIIGTGNQLIIDPESEERKNALDRLKAKRSAFRDEMFARTEKESGSLEKLAAWFAGCVNCYNCRAACPVCYCRECVFATDVFEYEPCRYLQWAERKGAVKMPEDTLFYHITRMAHISTACVGCGQCSNACPNEIPVMEIFRLAARSAQKAFDYEAGKSFDQAMPLSVFKEDEFNDTVGIGGRQ
ncbi:MAG: formate dehydrogenase, partial [bacterium]|nr:formate dehydrogenase [bacterium]